MPWWVSRGGVLLAGLCACAPEATPSPTPHLLSIHPTQQSAFAAQAVTVQLDVDPRFRVDYGEGSARMLEHFVLGIGGYEVPLDTYLGHGRFLGTIPAGLNVGRYDIQVTLGDGRETTLTDAYEVKPTVGVGFYVDTIVAQRVDEPFTIRVHAAGSGAELFEGTVNLTLYRGGTVFSPAVRTGAFSAGVRQEQLTLSEPGTYLVSVADDEGQGATSNSFAVEAKN